MPAKGVGDEREAISTRCATTCEREATGEMRIRVPTRTGKTKRQDQACSIDRCRLGPGGLITRAG